MQAVGAASGSRARGQGQGCSLYPVHSHRVALDSKVGQTSPSRRRPRDAAEQPWGDHARDRRACPMTVGLWVCGVDLHCSPQRRGAHTGQGCLWPRMGDAGHFTSTLSNVHFCEQHQTWSRDHEATRVYSRPLRSKRTSLRGVAPRQRRPHSER